ncbi:hypothetical protein BJX68DRAFT_264830 [Aspergillus pseudodeflectus]|uniref:Uncharacterized protein n=1 Tax=Aspergillus pseudodeflectus TaxID=176178 RepID=A0ABR4KS83_9EURO
MAMPTRSCGIPGIDYDATYVKNLLTSPGCLAGAFGLPSAKAIWALALRDPETKPIVDSWIEERKNFGKHALNNVYQPSLERLLADPAMHPILTSNQAPASTPVGRSLGRADIATLAKLTGLWYIARLVRAKPEIFPRSQVEPVLSLNGYDLLHGWKFLRWVWGEKARNRLGNYEGKRGSQATRPVFHIPALAIAAPAQTAGVPMNVQNPAAHSPAPVYTRDLTPNPVKTPEEEEALNLAIVHGLGDGTIAVEDTEPLFVEQTESEHAGDEEEDQEDDISEVAKVPISKEYITNSDDDAYDSGYDSADECWDIRVNPDPEQAYKATFEEFVEENADLSATPWGRVAST